MGATRAEKVYCIFAQKANKRAEAEKTEKGSRSEVGNMNKYRQELKRGVLYYIYPKIQDLQKLFLVPFGFLCGAIILSDSSKQPIMSIMSDSLINIVLAWLFIELLLYPSRYHLNDVRGINGDSKESDARERNGESRWGVPRLFEYKRMIKGDELDDTERRECKKKDIVRTLIIAGLKFGIAVAGVIYLWFANIPLANQVRENGYLICLSLAILAFVILSIIYEIGRSHYWKKGQLLVVGTGYAFRFIMGVLAVSPNLIFDDYIGIVSDLTFVMYLYGALSVSLIWTQRASKENPYKYFPDNHPELYTKAYNMVMDRCSSFHPLTKLYKGEDINDEKDLAFRNYYKEEREKKYSFKKLMASWNIILLIILLTFIITCIFLKEEAKTEMIVYIILSVILFFAIILRADYAQIIFSILSIIAITFTAVGLIIMDKSVMTAFLCVLTLIIITYTFLSFYNRRISIEEILGIIVGKETLSWLGVSIFELYDKDLGLSTKDYPDYVLLKKIRKILRQFDHMKYTCCRDKRTFYISNEEKKRLAEFTIKNGNCLFICIMDNLASADNDLKNRLLYIANLKDKTIEKTLVEIWNALCILNGKSDYITFNESVSRKSELTEKRSMK